MIVTLNDVLRKAKKEKYAVGLFNTVNLEMARGAIAAAEELRAPIIIGTAEVLLPSASLEELAYFLVPMAQKASVPVVLHYDHGLTESKIIEALNLGFSSVMYDCSTDEYQVNIEKVKKIKEIAQVFGASVEAELGHVGANENSAEGHANDKTIYTDPNEAADFVKRTNADCLAIAIGTSHGAYKCKPKLDLNRLEEIAKIVDVPLVLHGGSGLSDDDFKNCIASGISKVNIFTDINNACLAAAAKKYVVGMGMTEVMSEMTQAVKTEIMKKMLLFGCENRA